MKLASLRRPTIEEDSGGALYLVLGQVQHGPSGEAAFMHRATDGAQFDPDTGHALEVSLNDLLPANALAPVSPAVHLKSRKWH